jgi:hypothetical protein
MTMNKAWAPATGAFIGALAALAVLLVPALLAKRCSDDERGAAAAGLPPCYASPYEISWVTSEDVVPCGDQLCVCDRDEDGINMFCAPMERVPQSICTANAEVQMARRGKRLAEEQQHNATRDERRREHNRLRRAAMREILEELDALRAEAAKGKP